MAFINSQTSVLDSNGPIDSVEDLSAFSNFNVLNVDNNPPARPAPRKKWMLFGRGDGDNSSGGNRVLSILQNVSIGACLIACSSIIELIGNILALVYGIAYVQDACGFYEQEQQPKDNDDSENNYWEKLDQIQFLSSNRMGFVGLLATCIVGLIVAVLMPAGAICRSWKSLRAAMSLLLALCIAQMVLASFYIKDKELLATLAAVPYRVFEILIIYSFISGNKKKKLENVKKAAEANENNTGGGAAAKEAPNSPTTMSQNNLLSASEQIIENPMASDVLVNISMSVDRINQINQLAMIQEEGSEGKNTGKPRSKERKSKRRKNQKWQGDKKIYPPNSNVQQQDTYAQEYK